MGVPVSGLSAQLGANPRVWRLSEGSSSWVERCCGSAGPFDIAIYLAGADPYEGDRLGRLKVTKAGLARRDIMVVDRCVERNIPVAVAMAGGYAPQISDIVDIHAKTLEIFSAAARRRR